MRHGSCRSRACHLPDGLGHIPQGKERKGHTGEGRAEAALAFFRHLTIKSKTVPLLSNSTTGQVKPFSAMDGDATKAKTKRQWAAPFAKDWISGRGDKCIGKRTLKSMHCVANMQFH